MAIEKIYNDPEAGGVSQAVFEAHKHNYRKLMQIGGDSYDQWSSPTLEDVVDDTTTHASEVGDLEAVGVTVATSPTSTPI